MESSMELIPSSRTRGMEWLRKCVEGISFVERMNILSFVESLEQNIIVNFSGKVVLVNSRGTTEKGDEKTGIPKDYVTRLYGFWKVDKFRKPFLFIRRFKIMMCNNSIILWKLIPTRDTTRILSLRLELSGMIKIDSYLHCYFEKGLRVKDLSFKKAIGLNFHTKEVSPVWKDFYDLRFFTFSFFWFINRYDKDPWNRFEGINNLERVSMNHIGSSGDLHNTSKCLDLFFTKFTNLRTLKMEFTDNMNFKYFPKYRKEFLFPRLTKLKIRRVMTSACLSNFICNLPAIFPNLSYLEYRQEISSRWLKVLLQKQKLRYLECAGIFHDTSSSSSSTETSSTDTLHNTSLETVKIFSSIRNTINYSFQFFSQNCIGIRSLSFLASELTEEVVTSLSLISPNSLYQLNMLGGGQNITPEVIEKLGNLKHITCIQLMAVDVPIIPFIASKFEHLREFYHTSSFSGVKELKKVLEGYFLIAKRVKIINVCLRDNNKGIGIGGGDDDDDDDDSEYLLGMMDVSEDLGHFRRHLEKEKEKKKKEEERKRKIYVDFEERLRTLFLESKDLLEIDFYVTVGGNSGEIGDIDVVERK